MPQVSFYVTDSSEPVTRLKLACRITEKAWLAGHRVLVLCTSAEELQRFDDLLWTFGERSFVPHEPLQSADVPVESPVTLSQGIEPGGPIDVVVNLDAAVPACALRAARVAEFIDGDADRRDQGRARFRHYREQGITPVTHQIDAAASL